MSLSTSNSKRWRSLRRLSPILIGIVCFAVLLTGWKIVEPDLIEKNWLQPGSLSSFREEIRHFNSTRILYDSGLLSLPEVIFVGDSRIGFGIVPGVFTKHSNYTCEILTYPVHMGGQLLQMLELLSPLAPGRVIISLSPASLYQEQTFILPISLRDAGLSWSAMRSVIDSRIERMVHETRCRLVRPFTLSRTFTRMEPTLADQQFQTTLQKNKLLRDQQLEELGSKLRELKEKGWQIVLLRMPISPSLQAIEAAEFSTEKFNLLASRLGVPYLDFSENHNFRTLDGSHLTGKEAEEFSRDLAKEIRISIWPRQQQ